MVLLNKCTLKPHSKLQAGSTIQQTHVFEYNSDFLQIPRPYHFSQKGISLELLRLLKSSGFLLKEHNIKTLFLSPSHAISMVYMPPTRTEHVSPPQVYPGMGRKSRFPYTAHVNLGSFCSLNGTQADFEHVYGAVSHQFQI